MNRVLTHLQVIARAGTAFALVLTIAAHAQDQTHERAFHVPAPTVKKALQSMQGELAGHLPILDGFALATERSFDHYQRAYFQATVQVTATSTAECVVRVSAKVTAWYDDPRGAHSGYELLNSNGRIESDILDQLSQQLTAVKTAPDSKEVESAQRRSLEPSRSTPPAEPSQPMISAPQPHRFDSPSTLSSSISRGMSTAGASTPDAAAVPAADPERARLQDELDQLQEVLKNQTHPKNLAIVRKPGTAVVSTPSLSAKPMFLASAHDEFEILNFNQDWVHVRISGLSRGWIWRNDLDMPDHIPDTQAVPPKPTASDLFRVVREDTAPFPGDWEPLRGKNVKLISVQKADETKETGSQMKLEFAKSVFAKTYAEMSQKSPDLSGIVLIFDSADGGMIAATQPMLEKWKVGALTDAGFWHSCYFDPPETFSAGGNAASQ